MSSQHHGFLQPQASRATLKTTPSPPKGRRFNIQGHLGHIQCPVYSWDLYSGGGLDGRNLDSPQNPLRCPLPEPSRPLLPPGGAKCPSSELPVHYVPCLSLAEHTPQKCLQAICPFLPRGVQASQARARSYSLLCPWQISETQVFMERTFNYHHDSLAGTSLAGFQINQWKPSIA